MDEAAWACQTECFANNPQTQPAAGLGELEIKAESLRFATCACNDLLQDAAFNIDEATHATVVVFTTPGCTRVLISQPDGDCVEDRSGTQNSGGVSSALSSVEFVTSSNGGGFNTSEITTSGPQLFTGSTSSPTFSAGTFDLTTLFPIADVPGVLTVTDLSTAAVPEPSPLAIFALGLFAIGPIGRWRRNTLKPAI